MGMISFLNLDGFFLYNLRTAFRHLECSASFDCASLNIVARSIYTKLKEVRKIRGGEEEEKKIKKEGKGVQKEFKNTQKRNCLNIVNRRRLSN